jgi:uncharacterized membrane protein
MGMLHELSIILLCSTPTVAILRKIKKEMIIALKVLLGVISLALLFLGLNWMFNTKKFMKEHDIDTSSSTGFNYLRGDIGGILMTGFIFIVMFLYQGSEYWLYPSVILIGAVIFGRITSLIADGKSIKGIQAIAVEVLIIILLFAIHAFSH